MTTTKSIFIKEYISSIVFFFCHSPTLWQGFTKATHRLIATGFVTTQIISMLLLRGGCIVTNWSGDAMCEDSQSETPFVCGGKSKEMC